MLRTCTCIIYCTGLHVSTLYRVIISSSFGIKSLNAAYMYAAFIVWGLHVSTLYRVIIRSSFGIKSVNAAYMYAAFTDLIPKEDLMMTL